MPNEQAPAQQTLYPGTPCVSRKKRGNKIVHDGGADAGEAQSGSSNAGGADAGEAQSSSSNAGGADAGQAPVHAGQAPVPPVDAGEPPVDAGQPAVDAGQAPADPWSNDTRSDARSVDQGSARSTRSADKWRGSDARPYMRTADATGWSESDASSAYAGWSTRSADNRSADAYKKSGDADGWSSSDASGAYGRSAHSSWEIVKRVEQLEEQVRQLQAQNKRLLQQAPPPRSAGLIQTSPRVDAGAAGSGGAGAGGSDAGGSAAGGADAGDSAAGYADANNADASWDTGGSDAEDERPRWYNSNVYVDDETLAKAKKCMKKRLHRVGKLFLITDEGQGHSVCYWDWYAACRDRGMHQFAHRGANVDDRPGASFKCWKDGKSCFTARAVCLHCRSMILVTTPGTGKFRSKDDVVMCKYFMVDPLTHPASMIR